MEFYLWTVQEEHFCVVLYVYYVYLSLRIRILIFCCIGKLKTNILQNIKCLGMSSGNWFSHSKFFKIDEGN